MVAQPSVEINTLTLSSVPCIPAGSARAEKESVIAALNLTLLFAVKLIFGLIIQAFTVFPTKFTLAVVCPAKLVELDHTDVVPVGFKF